MTEQRDDHEATAKRLVQKWESEQHFLELTPVQFTRLENYVAAALAEAHHCKWCCCARSWAALGVLDSKGMSIPEHIDELRAKLAEAERENQRWKEIQNDEVIENCEIAEAIGIIDDIKNGRSYRDAEIDLFKRLREEISQKQDLLAAYVGLVDKLKAERDALQAEAIRLVDDSETAFVRGLERGKEIVETLEWHGDIEVAIQAEIDKAKR